MLKLTAHYGAYSKATLRCKTELNGVGWQLPTDLRVAHQREIERVRKREKWDEKISYI